MMPPAPSTEAALVPAEFCSAIVCAASGCPNAVNVTVSAGVTPLGSMLRSRNPPVERVITYVYDHAVNAIVSIVRSGFGRPSASRRPDAACVAPYRSC